MLGKPMLVELTIRDFALIEALQVSWTQGLNVLTGETGAGKSILIDALNVVLGGKTAPSVIRHGCDKAVIEATFTTNQNIVSWLAEQKLLNEDESHLTIAREIGRTGSRVRVNGTLVNLSALVELRQLILTMHAQMEARTLLSSQSQLEMLDGLADEAGKQLAEDVRAVYAQKRQLSQALEKLTVSEEERLRKLEYARFQLQELEQACLHDANEDSTIAGQLSVLENATQLEEKTIKAQECLSGAEATGSVGAIDLLEQAQRQLDSALAIDNRLASTAGLLAEASETLRQAARYLRKYGDTLETDPEALSNLQARLALIASIKRKYGPTLEQALARKNSLLAEVDQLENIGSEAAAIERQLAEASTKLKVYSEKLSSKRRIWASALAKQVQTELLDLGMEQCQFEVAVEGTEIGLNGADHIEFLIAPNPGQPPVSVSKIASGGELSRIMLAIKTITAQGDQPQTIVFDEIDSGLSGRALKSVRDRLIKLARSHQILCITHQPIIASAAHNHLHVTKMQTKTSTHVKVENLLGDRRIQELASMASGKNDKEEALQFARSLYAEGIALLGP